MHKFLGDKKGECRAVHPPQGTFFKSSPDKTVYDQVVEELLRSGRPDAAALQLPEAFGKALHIFRVAAAGVEAGALVQFRYEFRWGGGDYRVATLESVGLVHAASFLVLSLKYNFSVSLRNGMFSRVVLGCTVPACAKVIIFSIKCIQADIFVKFVDPECWRNSTVQWRA